QELVTENRFEFGQFVAREALLDEEYWTAAWLRAESHWEDRKNERFVLNIQNNLYVENFKRMFADQVEKQEKNKKRTVLKSVVGTLDLIIRYPLHGETFPGERTKTPLFCSINGEEMNRYGYVSNLCVAKSARRRGIASDMPHFAVEMAKINVKSKMNCAPQVFVHVLRKNQPAQELYRKLGFEVKCQTHSVRGSLYRLTLNSTFLVYRMVKMASPQSEEDQTYLLCCKL
ncbi:FR47-like, partial [Dillenia turbinata]